MTDNDDFPNLRKYMRDRYDTEEMTIPDHKDAAMTLLGNSTPLTLAAAQVHATLYLAEQQRLANLIQFTQSFGHPKHLREEIDKGLGL